MISGPLLDLRLDLAILASLGSSLAQDGARHEVNLIPNAQSLVYGQDGKGPKSCQCYGPLFLTWL